MKTYADYACDVCGSPSSLIKRTEDGTIEMLCDEHRPPAPDITWHAGRPADDQLTEGSEWLLRHIDGTHMVVKVGRDQMPVLIEAHARIQPPEDTP